MRIFGESFDMQPVPFDFEGETGWFRLPRGFYTKTNPLRPNELIASPNANFSTPVYYCTLHQNQQDYVFQDLWLSMLYRTAGNNNWQPNGL